MEKCICTPHRGKNAVIWVLSVLMWVLLAGQSAWAISPLMHSSVNLGTKYGNWGTTYDCSTCHDIVSANVKRVKQSITTPLGARTVVFQRMTAASSNNGTTGVFGNDLRTYAVNSSQNICEVCHHQTLHHQYSSAKITDRTTNPHYNNQDCAGTCHPHKTGFKGAGCNGCHGNPPTTASIGGSTGLASPATGATSPASPGAHSTHVTGKGMLCATCHTGTTMPAVSNSIEMGFVINGTNWPGFAGNVTFGSFSGHSPLNAPYTGVVSSNTGTTVKVNTGYRNSCNLYCHGSWTGANGSMNPSWVITDGTQKACGTCHGASAAQPPTTNAHSKHAGSSGYSFSCTNCHGTLPTDTTHVNGNVAISLTTGIYSRTTGIADPASANGSCNGTYCHSNGVTLATGGTPVQSAAAVWNSGAQTCASCHGNPPSYDAKKYPSAVTFASWSTPANAYQDDDAYTTSRTTTTNTNTLTLTGFGFTTTEIADTDEIKGINVYVTGYGTNATATNRVIQVQLVDAGVAVGNKLNITLPQNIPTTQVVNTSPTAFAGPGGVFTGWTPAKLRASNFGVQINNSVTLIGGNKIDSVKVVLLTNKVKNNSHTTHINAVNASSALTCATCHYTVTTNGTTIANAANHDNKGISYTLAAQSPATFTYSYNAGGSSCSTASCHSQGVLWGADVLDCVSCHAYAQGKRAAVSNEFGLKFGHKKAGRNPVNKFDCCVCHLEGDATTGKTTSYHKNGNIDLRDPWGAGATPITNMSGTSFTFRRFSTSYASGSRTSTGHTNNADIAQVITLRFCIRCHSKQGATNPTARSGAGATATMPWGGVNLGSNYTVANGASVAGGVVNVFSQFSTGNSSYHPVRGPLNRDFPTAALLQVPYKNTGSRGTAGSKSLSVVINCFDCHNNSTGAMLTLRTVSAHGTNNTYQITGAMYSTGPFCIKCHITYTNAVNHPTGSAGAGVNGDGAEYMGTYCQNCHASSSKSGTPVPARPIPAADAHGFNNLLNGGLWPTVNGRPYAFIRNTQNYVYHRPSRASEFASGSPTCSGGSTQCAGNSGTRTYTPGGSF